jgi:hypothetical protein
MQTVNIPRFCAAMWPALLAFAAAPVSCGGGNPPDGGRFSDAIAAEVRRGPGTVLDLHALAPFQWTRFFVFGPYRTKNDAERVLGRRWSYNWSAVEFYDDRSFLVFTDSGRVVAAFDQDNDRGNFMALFRSAGYAPDSARFVVRDAGRFSNGSPNLELSWLP